MKQISPGSRISELKPTGSSSTKKCNKCGAKLPPQNAGVLTHWCKPKMSSSTKKRILKPKPIKDPAYLDFIRTKPCICCSAWWNFHGQTTPTEAAHVGDRGLGQKCSDREAIPLCERHHRTGPLAHHKLGKKFWAYHSLDRNAIIAQLNKEYETNGCMG